MMAYTLFNIAKNPAEVILGSVSKEALVEHIVTPDKWRLRFKPDAFEARHMGTDTRGYNPDKYVPTFFDMVAMNQNDRQAMSNVRYTVIPTKPALWWSPIMRQRCFMVKDENGRVIDVREWLDECRMALRRMAVGGVPVCPSGGEAGPHRLPEDHWVPAGPGCSVPAG